LEVERDEILLGLIELRVRRQAPPTKSQRSEVTHERDAGRQSV